MSKRQSEALQIKSEFGRSTADKPSLLATERLLDLLVTLAADIDAIRSDTEYLKRNDTRRRIIDAAKQQS